MAEQFFKHGRDNEPSHPGVIARANRNEEIVNARNTMIAFLEQTEGWHDIRSIAHDTDIPMQLVHQAARSGMPELLYQPGGRAFKLLTKATPEDLQGEITVQEAIIAQAQARIERFRAMLNT